MMSDQLHETGTPGDAVRLNSLSRFPEENPNPVIEMTLAGQTAYLNPAAQALFPDLYDQGSQHPLMQDLQFPFALDPGESRFVIEREIQVHDRFFDQKVCYVDEGDRNHIRIYVHDITRRKRAEDANRRLAKQLLDAHEQERQRVSRELHDESGQALTALQLSLELIRKALPDNATVASENLADAIELAAATREQIRLLALGLRPPSLDAVGLDITLASICRDFSKRTGLDISYEGENAAALPDAISICLYRTLQEALANVAKHADATCARVSFNIGHKEVTLSVEDDGKGLDQTILNNPDSRAGIGLLGMQERLQLLGGALILEKSDLGGLLLFAAIEIPDTETESPPPGDLP